MRGQIIEIGAGIILLATILLAVAHASDNNQAIKQPTFFEKFKQAVSNAMAKFGQNPVMPTRTLTSIPNVPEKTVQTNKSPFIQKTQTISPSPTPIQVYCRKSNRFTCDISIGNKAYGG